MRVVCFCCFQLRIVLRCWRHGHEDDVSGDCVSCIMATSSGRIMIGSPQLLLLAVLVPLSVSFVTSRGRNTSSNSSLHPQFVHHSELWLATFLRNVTETFPHLTHVYSIGKSVQGLSDRCLSVNCFVISNFTALVLLVGWEVGHPAYKNSCFNHFQKFTFEGTGVTWIDSWKNGWLNKNQCNDSDINVTAVAAAADILHSRHCGPVSSLLQLYSYIFILQGHAANSLRQLSQKPLAYTGIHMTIRKY